jgi:hypothetical protein
MNVSFTAKKVYRLPGSFPIAAGILGEAEHIVVAEDIVAADILGADLDKAVDNSGAVVPQAALVVADIAVGIVVAAGILGEAERIVAQVAQLMVAGQVPHQILFHRIETRTK